MNPELQAFAELLGPLLEPLVGRLVDARLAARGPAAAAAEHVTVHAYASAHAVCAATVRAAFRDGRLEGIRVGKRSIRIRRDAKIGPSATGRASADAKTPAAIADRILARGIR
jgi:hypothetical protein